MNTSKIPAIQILMPDRNMLHARIDKLGFNNIYDLMNHNDAEDHCPLISDHI